MSSYLILSIGIALAALGGDLFVRGILGIARWLRVPAGVVAATLAAFATSAPELSIGVNAALAGAPQIAIGDSLGSNVVNLGLILGAMLILGGVRIAKETLTRNLAAAALAPVATAALMVEGELGRLHAAALMGLFFAWLAATLIDAHRRRTPADALAGKVKVLTAAQLAVGLAAMAVGGHLIVVGASGLATSWGVDQFIVGALITAIGTSTPEIAVALTSRFRGHGDLSLGTLLGSNIFNGLFIVPLVCLIEPASVPLREALPVLGFGLVVVALAYPGRGGALTRGRGVLLVATYTAFVMALLPTGGSP